MRQAVNKRKETLARKKQKQSDEKNPTKTSTPTPQPEMPPSQSRTPVTATAPSLPQHPAAAGSSSAQPSPVDNMGSNKNLPPQQDRHRDFGGILMSGEYNGPPALPGGIRAPSQVAMQQQHDDRQVLGYMQDGGPPPPHMPLPGGIWEAHARSYANGGGREEQQMNGDRHGGGAPGPGWGPQP